MRSRSSFLALAPPLALTAVACSAPSDEEISGADEARVTELKSYWADAKRLDLGDLTRVAVGFATEGGPEAAPRGRGGSRAQGLAGLAHSVMHSVRMHVS